MRFYKWLITLIIIGLIGVLPAQAQSDKDDSTFVPNPFLRDDIRTPPKPKPQPPKGGIKEVTKSGKTIPAQPLNRAKVSFDHMKFDFGSIAAGATITHNFPIKNIGSDSLYISRIRPS